MRIIEQSVEPMRPLNKAALVDIERAGRTCYKSEDKITNESASDFVCRLIKSGHESVIEHASETLVFITNRGVTHELVRHRLVSYSQESTRYVNYGDREMEFILPVWWTGPKPAIMNARLQSGGQLKLGDGLSLGELCWLNAIHDAEKAYKTIVGLTDWRPEQAREVLPNSLKTEIVVTANFRQWRHMLRLRTSKAAHPQIRALMKGAHEILAHRYPVVFEDI